MMKEVSPIKIEKVILVGVSNRNLSQEEAFSSLDELELLVSTAGGEVCSKIIQNKDRIDSRYYIGKGKAEYIKELCISDNLDSIVFDEDLSPVQVRNLETLTGKKILDRSAVILDIFAQHAKTVEAKTQVELAQLEYLLPRLTRRWTHFSKQYGGIGTKGPGETQIETDRRFIKKKISVLKEKLAAITRQKETQRKQRSSLPRVALAGYTNAGKSTILNLLSGAEVLSENKLFSTLDTTVRQVDITPSRKFLLSDTVGFIKKLPHDLIASFMSTLSEVIESDILLHVCDITSPKVEEQIKVVEDTLSGLNCKDKPTILVFNKIDLLKNRDIIQYINQRFENCIFISAQRALNINTLINKILEFLDYNLKEYKLELELSDQKILAFIHSLSEVTKIDYQDDKIQVQFTTSENNFKKILEEKANLI
jgi:GTPase